jgi:hypothetical protein
MFLFIIFPQAHKNKSRIISIFFLKIPGDICKSRCTTVVNNTGGKFATNTAGVVDTGGQQRQ